jgi:uncharacterized protein (TIGR03083 family)
MELSSAEAHELVGAYVLDALDGPDRTAFEHRLDRDPELGRVTADLLEAASLLGAGDADPPPADLAERTFATAFARRPPGTPATAADPDPAAVYRAQLDDLSTLVDSLAPGDWTAATITGWTVHELMAHLLAIEGYTARLLGVDDSFAIPEGTETDHLGMTEPTVEAWSSGDPAATVDAWRRLVAANVAHLQALPAERLEDRVSFHGLDLSIRSFLGVRTFEVWTHTDDVRRAVGRPLDHPDPVRLRFMSRLAVNALPLGLAMSGIDDTGRTVRILLTGAGGGEWLQALTIGAEAGSPDATLVADVVDFCRLAAQRLAPDDLPHTAEGDQQVVRDVLVGAQVFAA